MDDQSIIELFFARSEAALEQIAEKYGDYCYAIAYRIVGDEGDACECVNDTYLRAWDAIPPKRPRRLRLFLGAITRNLSLHLYERRHAQKRGNTQTSCVLDEIAFCVPSGENADRITEDLVIRDCLNRFLKGLSKRERWVFMRRYWNMDAIGEIARVMGVSENYIAVMLSRLRKKLKSALQKEGICL